MGLVPARVAVIPALSLAVGQAGPLEGQIVDRGGLVGALEEKPGQHGSLAPQQNGGGQPILVHGTEQIRI